MRLITPDWDAPSTVSALTTTRAGGVSQGPYESLNLAVHTGDDLENVRLNRRILRESRGWTEEPLWLNQVHGTRIVRAEEIGSSELPAADGAYTRLAGKPLVILTADCLPVLVCDRAGTVVGAFHAGWRGLAAGVLEKGIESMETDPGELLAWIGPGIGSDHYQVGPEVYEAFVRDDGAQKANFRADGAAKWKMDLAGAAMVRLEKLGVGKINQTSWCTYRDKDLFFSHRREAPCGRMATSIAILRDATAL